ncbi:MAG: carbon-nitrogen hydrolase family protein [Planctomycetes bacterium]|nr:carbon-nitrogen hydrolase family protein [Planctomycetota bacterium]
MKRTLLLLFCLLLPRTYAFSAEPAKDVAADTRAATEREDNRAPADAPQRRFARVIASVVTLPWSDEGRSLDTVRDRLNEAGARGSDIVCLPMECVHTEGEAIPGPLSTAIAAKARAHDMYVIGNLRETEGDKTYVTSFLCGRDGQLVGKYRKSHKMPDEAMDLGDDLPVNAHVEIDRAYGVQGVDVLFDLTQDWGPDAIHRNVRNISRAMDGQFFRVEATHATSEVQHRSHVVEPTGTIVAQSQYMSNGLVSAVIDLDNDRPRRFTRQWRAHEPAGYLPEYQFTQLPRMENDLQRMILAQRRPELYQVFAPQ